MEEGPRQIGRFRIQRELGRGAMGVVYEALDPDLERVVAVKTVRIPEGVADDERTQFEARFMAEAKAAGRLSHPGIVVVHEVGRDAETGTLFMALERLRGRTLAELMATRGALEWREALVWVGRIAEALAHAHENGIVHRDVKPANVMVLDSGDLKVMDFGIAKLVADHAQLTATGQFFGTPLYMSPEQALGDAVDGRSDLFSLGVVLHQLLTGRRLFDAESVPRILTRIAYEPARPPSESASTVPPEVDAIVLRLLAKSPGDRYPDGRRLAEDVRRVLADQAPEFAEATTAVGEATQVSARAARPPAPGPRDATPVASPPVRPPGRRLVWLLAGSLALVVAIAVVAPRTPDPFAETGPPPLPPPSSAPESGSALPTPEPTPEPEGPVEPARLLIDFQHHYKDGRIRVWVDRTPMVDHRIGGRVTTDVVGIKMRKGQFDADLEVSPGRHDVTVQVDWDDNKRYETISGRFEGGRSRRLKVRIDRFLKRMSLDWD